MWEEQQQFGSRWHLRFPGCGCTEHDSARWAELMGWSCEAQSAAGRGRLAHCNLQAEVVRVHVCARESVGVCVHVCVENYMPLLRGVSLSVGYVSHVWWRAVCKRCCLTFIILVEMDLCDDTRSRRADRGEAIAFGRHTLHCWGDNQAGAALQLQSIWMENAASILFVERAPNKAVTLKWIISHTGGWMTVHWQSLNTFLSSLAPPHVGMKADWSGTSSN